jgi:hypothetical protein
MDMTNTTTTVRSNSLADLAARITAEHQAASDALKASVHHAIACGTLLMTQKTCKGGPRIGNG